MFKSELFPSPMYLYPLKVLPGTGFGSLSSSNLTKTGTVLAAFASFFLGYSAVND